MRSVVAPVLALVFAAASGCLSEGTDAGDECIGADCERIRGELSLAGCTSVDHLIFVPAANSQVPSGWEPFLAYDSLAQVAVLTYTCDAWTTESTELGSGSIAFVGEYILVGESDSASAPTYDLFIYHVVTDVPALAAHMDTFEDVRNGTFASPARPVDPDSYAFEAEDLSFSAALLPDDPTIHQETHWRLYGGEPGTPPLMVIDSREFSTSSQPHAFTASGGAFEEALPATAWTGVARVIQVEGGVMSGSDESSTT